MSSDGGDDWCGAGFVRECVCCVGGSGRKTEPAKNINDCCSAAVNAQNEWLLLWWGFFFTYFL